MYRTSIGIAYICLGPGKSLKQGLAMAVALLQNERTPAMTDSGCYGVCNSLKNHDDLISGSPLSLVLARSGTYTERSIPKILETFTGFGQIKPSRLHRLMADRPALTFPYHPYIEKSYKRIKPAFVPPEIKMKYVTPFGTVQNELLLAGKIVNSWSDDYYQTVTQNLDFTLWITEGEKKAMCLSLMPLLLGEKLDVIGIPGVWMWGKKQADNSWDLAPELKKYKFSEGKHQRLVGIAFDNDSWKNPKVADALLKLCETLRIAGALVFVAVLPPGPQKGVDDYFKAHCVTANGFDFTSLQDVLNKSIYVDRLYSVNYPSPEVHCRLKTLQEKARWFDDLQLGRLSETPATLVDDVVLEIGMYLDTESSDLNGGRFLSLFQSKSPDEQLTLWESWLHKNPFQAELDLQLDRYIPGLFRGRTSTPTITLGQVVKENLKLDQLKDLNYY